MDRSESRILPKSHHKIKPEPKRLLSWDGLVRAVGKRKTEHQGSRYILHADAIPHGSFQASHSEFKRAEKIAPGGTPVTL